MKIREKAVTRFEDSLDIRSFMSVSTNLRLILSMILTDEQAFMFQNHKARHIEPDRREKEREVDEGLDGLQDHGALARAVSEDRARKLPNFYLGT